MLKIKTIRGDGAGAARYYSRENGQRPDEYYGREADIRPTWWTPGETFGVKNGAEVQPGEVKQAMEGREPDGSGRSLVQAQSRTVLDKRTGKMKPQERRCAYDLNMTLPKSASLVFAAADRETRAAMLAETREVARQVLGEMHRQGAFVVRQGKGGKGQAAGSDALALVDVHQSPRDGSPFLHAHAVVMNFGRRGDGKTATLNDRPMMLAAAEAGALFRAGMAAALERRGFGIERVVGEERQRAASFRIAGVSPDLDKSFSGRKARMIAYVVAKDGAVSKNPLVRHRQMQEAAQNTRGSKAQVPVGTDLEKLWHEQMRERGHPPERIWREARAAARSIERPTLSAAEVVALRVQRSGREPNARTQRLRVAEEAQYRGIGVAGAVREMARMERDGWQQVAREAERQQIRDGLGRTAEGIGRAAGEMARDGLLSALGGKRDQGGGGGGDSDTAPRRRRRGQDQGQER